MGHHSITSCDSIFYAPRDVGNQLLDAGRISVLSDFSFMRFFLRL